MMKAATVFHLTAILALNCAAKVLAFFITACSIAPLPNPLMLPRATRRDLTCHIALRPEQITFQPGSIKQAF